MVLCTQSHQTYLDVDLLPVPPPPILPLNRKPSLSSTSSKSTTPQQQLSQSHHHHKKSTSCKSSVLNCATNCVIETTTPNKSKSHQFSPKHIITDHQSSYPAPHPKHTTIKYHDPITKANADSKTAKRKSTAAFDLLPIGADEHQTDTDAEDNLFFCHYEPQQVISSTCGTYHHFPHRQNAIKYNTIAMSNHRPRTSSTANYELSQMADPNFPNTNNYPSNPCGHQPQPSLPTHSAYKTKSNSVLSLSDLQLPFINSLINYDYPPNDYLIHNAQCLPDDHFANYNTRVRNTDELAGSTDIINDVGRPGSSSTNDSYYASKLFGDADAGILSCKLGGEQGVYRSDCSGLNNGGMSHQQQDGSNNNIPWRHRQCPSVGGSSSSSTSIMSEFMLALKKIYNFTNYFKSNRMGPVSALVCSHVDSTYSYGSRRCSAFSSTCERR